MLSIDKHKLQDQADLLFIEYAAILTDILMRKDFAIREDLTDGIRLSDDYPSFFKNFSERMFSEVVIKEYPYDEAFFIRKFRDVVRKMISDDNEGIGNEMNEDVLKEYDIPGFLIRSLKEEFSPRHLAELLCSNPVYRSDAPELIRLGNRLEMIRNGMLDP